VGATGSELPAGRRAITVAVAIVAKTDCACEIQEGRRIQATVDDHEEAEENAAEESAAKESAAEVAVNIFREK